jgi:anti-sigma B factor antagonist
MYEVWQLLGFSQVFKIEQSLDEAVSFFAAPGEEGKGEIFPRILNCPICGKQIWAAKPGRFRCYECKTILHIDNAGQLYER